MGQYLRARYYDPATGRFNRLDPYAGNNQDPQSLHKYLYAHANPVMNVDPSGLFSIIGVSAANGISADLAGLQGELGQIGIESADSLIQGYSADQATRILASSLLGGVGAGALLSIAGKVSGAILDRIADFIGDSGQEIFRLLRSRKKPYHYGDLETVVDATGRHFTRPTGARAIITKKHLNKKRHGLPQIAGTGGNIIRGHLIADVLGGAPGPENLALQFHQRVNSSAMKQIENAVLKRVRAGETIDYMVIPIYRGSDPMALGFTIRARGDRGFFLEESVRNTPNLPRVGDVPKPRTF